MNFLKTLTATAAASLVAAPMMAQVATSNVEDGISEPRRAAVEMYEVEPEGQRYYSEDRTSYVVFVPAETVWVFYDAETGEPTETRPGDSFDPMTSGYTADDAQSTMQNDTMQDGTMRNDGESITGESGGISDNRQ